MGLGKCSSLGCLDIWGIYRTVDLIITLDAPRHNPPIRDCPAAFNPRIVKQRSTRDLAVIPIGLQYHPSQIRGFMLLIHAVLFG